MSDYDVARVVAILGVVFSVFGAASAVLGVVLSLLSWAWIAGRP